MYMQQGGLFEASGIGDYDRTGNWEWEYYPPPYDFLAPPDSVAMPAPVLAVRGVGCGGDCSCGGACGHDHAKGVGLFDSTDMSEWGIGEWAAIAVGGYLAIKLFGDVGKASKTIKRSRSRSKRRQQLRQQADSF